MTNAIEIELRYEILDPAQVNLFFTSAQQLGKKRIVDVYWDTPERILWKKGIFVRTRNNKKLDIKFNRECLDNPDIERLDYCEEHSFQLPIQISDLPNINQLLTIFDLKTVPGAGFEAFIAANSFSQHYVIDKIRTEYSYRGFTISIDEVAQLGTFLEIELMAENHENLEQVKRDMQQALAGLKLAPLRLGYCSMMVKKHQYECYRQGRYVLKEDRINR